jgi:hypothetical protein
MKYASVLVLAAVAGSAFSTVAVGAEIGAPTGVAAPDEQFQRMIATAMLPSLPKAHRDAIIAAGGLGAEGYAALRDRSGELLVSHDDRYERVRELVSPALFARMHEEHLGVMLETLDRAEKGETPKLLCFAPGTDPELVAAFSAMFQEEFWGGATGEERFQIGARWSTTASSFSTGGTGNPIVLTYSFPPDGALADNLSGQNRANQFNAWMNGIYGSQAVWQPIFASVFNRWSDLIGVDYIYEPNDDGVEANTQPGVLGVRGDVRIFAVTLDGSNGVLAYNEFPNNGDMVFDAFDGFFNSTTQQSRRLRNVTSHEHGHGLGFLHVCPANSTKLMEPFVSTSYDGPQLDDILAGQRNYGDLLENNDTSGTASNLGNVFVGSSQNLTNLSIDDNSDIDFYRVNVTQPLEIGVTVTPDAAAYQQGPQTSSCNTGTLTDYNSIHNLQLEVRASNGTTVLASSNTGGTGQPESLDFTITTPGTYFVVVRPSTTTNNIQRYRMDLTGGQIPFNGPTIVAQQSDPTVVAPGVPVVLDYQVLPNADTIIDGPDLSYRFDGGAFTTVAMTPLGGNIFRGTIPGADCDDSPEYYISVVGQVVGEVNLPLAGENDPASYSVGAIDVSFSDNFETNTGWDGSLSTATAGQWDRGVPVASTGAPSSDFDGSGQCWVTGNAAGEDVDFGLVILRSPSLNTVGGASLSYAYWLGGSLGTGDRLRVEVSYNGQITWSTLKEYNAVSGGWVTDSVEVPAGDGVASTFFRFVAEDASTDNTVEAAIDAVSLSTVVCTEPGGCNAADIGLPYGVLDLADINAFILGFTGQDPVADIAAPFGVWDLADIGLFTQSFLAGCP